MSSNDTTPALRLTMLTFIVVALLGALLSRLWFLQVLAGDRYAELAESNALETVLTDAPRGRILDRAGEEIVKNRVALTISADRTRLLNAAGEPKDETAQAAIDRLSELLDMTEPDIIEAMTSVRYSHFRPTPIAIDVPQEVVFAVVEHAELFPGVVAERLPVRTYPQGDLGAHLVGYTREIDEDELADPYFAEVGYRAGDIVGKSGLERTYERELQGTVGQQVLQVNASGNVLDVVREIRPRPGHDLVTTLDVDLQAKVEAILEEGILSSRDQLHASSKRPLPSTGGAAVVMDPTNGEILAMASYPTYDPSEFVGALSEEYSRYLYPQEGDPNTHHPAINRAISSAQPPGSAWKIVSGLAALRAGQISPDSYLDCPGVFSEWEKYNWNRRSEGRMDLATALKRSCDTFFYELSHNQWLAERREVEAGGEPTEVYAEVARELGFDEPLGIDLPAERGGVVPGREWKQAYWEANRDNLCERAETATPGTYAKTLYTDLCNEGHVWRGGDAVNMSIGQGEVQTTPLQIAAAYATVANGGTLWWPHLGKEIRTADGELVETIEPRVLNQVEAPDAHWAELQQGLEEVVMGDRGTGVTPFADFPLDTIPVAGKTGTAEAGSQVPYSWFAAYAPADAPQYVVTVLVEEGGGGSQTAAPIVRRILDAVYGHDVQPFEAGDASILD